MVSFHPVKLHVSTQFKIDAAAGAGYFIRSRATWSFTNPVPVPAPSAIGWLSVLQWVVYWILPHDARARSDDSRHRGGTREGVAVMIDLNRDHLVFNIDMEFLTMIPPAVQGRHSGVFEHEIRAELGIHDSKEFREMINRLRKAGHAIGRHNAGFGHQARGRFLDLTEGPTRARSISRASNYWQMVYGHEEVLR